MSDISRRMAALSTEERKLLAKRIAEKQKEKAAKSWPTRNAQIKLSDLSFNLSPVQQVYWTGRSGLYDLGCCGANVYTEFEVTGLDETFLNAINHAFERVIDRHDMLRAVFLPNGTQRILSKTPPYQIKLIDLRGQERQAVERQLEYVRNRMRTEKAPIDRWPLFEFLAHRLSDKRARFHLRIEAFLLDGTSRGILLRELFQLACDPNATLNPLDISYRDCIQACDEQRQGAQYKAARDYWMSRIERMPPPLEFPSNGSLISHAVSRFSNQTFELLDPQEWVKLKARATQSGLTASGAVTAAFMEAAGLRSKNSNFTLGIVGSYRPPAHPQIHSLIGNFNTLYLLESDPVSGSFEARAKRLHKQFSTNLEHHLFSGFEVLREMNRRRRFGSKSAMPILFNCLLESKHFARWRDQNYEEKDEDRSAPSVKEMDGSLYMPQVILIPTVMESSDSFLICKWQVIDDAFPGLMSQEIFSAYRSFLKLLANEESSWHKTPQEIFANTAFARPVMNITDANSPEERSENREAQPAYSPDAERTEPAYSKQNGIEIQITQIWKELLGVASVGATDNFFDLGGDSFLAVCLANRLSVEFGREFSLRGFLQEPTVIEMARLIKQQLEAKPRASLAKGN